MQVDSGNWIFCLESSIRFPLEGTQAAQAQVNQWQQLFANSRLPQPIEPVTRESMPIGV
jgi:hypothetical protein